MKEIVILIILTGSFLITFISTLIIGLIKRNGKLIFVCIVSLILTFGTGFYTGYKIVTNTDHKLYEWFRPRTGEEIYNAFFCKPQTNCVKILNFQDQIIPKIDYAIWLHFKTCPEELNRVLSLKKFELKKISTKDMHSSGPLANENWFMPELMGDSILIYDFRLDENGNGQTIFCNTEKTEAYCMDVWD